MLNNDQYEQIVNDQEDIIADLRNKLLEMTDSRDLALRRALNLLNELRRVECCEDLELAKTIARQAIDSFSGK